MLFKHVKTGGIYRLQMIATNEADMTPSAIYANAETGMIWVRPASEFFDGRFEVFVPPAQAPDGGFIN